jgi:hypothetical protein
LIVWKRKLPLLYFSLLLAPLFIASLSRPFAFWDDVTIPVKLEAMFATRFEDLPQAFLVYWTAVSYVFRPVALFLYNLYYLVFGGELWVMHVLKMLARAAYLLLSNHLLRINGYGWLTRLVVITFLLFHPALLDTMTFADDVWLALWSTALLILGFDGLKRAWDLSEMTLPRYSAFVALFIAATGSKEAGVVPALVFSAAATWRAPTRLAAPDPALPDCYLLHRSSGTDDGDARPNDQQAGRRIALELAGWTYSSDAYGCAVRFGSPARYRADSVWNMAYSSERRVQPANPACDCSCVRRGYSAVHLQRRITGGAVRDPLRSPARLAARRRT